MKRDTKRDILIVVIAVTTVISMNIIRGCMAPKPVNAELIVETDVALGETINVVNLVRRDIIGTDLETKYGDRLNEAVYSLKLIKKTVVRIADEKGVKLKEAKREPHSKSLERLKETNKKLQKIIK